MTKAIRIVSIAAVILLAALVLPIPTAHVAEAYIPPSDVWVAPPPLGSNSNPGTQAQPFASIKWGLDNVAQDGTVHVAAGTYHEHQLPYHYGQDLVGAGAQNTIIDGDGIGPVLSISSGSWENVISGFTIQNGNASGNTTASLWNPADEQVLYAGIKLPPIKMLQQLFNGGPSQGGGIYISGGHSVTLNDCVIKDNHAEYGGGIYNEGQLTMNRCTVSGNSAIYAGGGILNSETANLINSTISGNSLTVFEGLGAGILTSYHLELCNVTLAYNTATGAASRGGGIASMPGNFTAFFKNCIVAHNTAGTPGTNNAFYLSADDMVSQGNNIDSENSCNFDQPGDMVNTNPLLGPLQDNGGPTFTHALLEGSPAIDAGTCMDAPATDQRGVTRPQGDNCDIGAFELVEEEDIVVPPPGPGSSPFVQTPPRPLNPSQLSAQYVSVSPQQTYANQPVTITTNVVNTGDEAGNLNVALKINGLVEQSRMVGVGPQGTQPVKFTITKAQPGTYTVDILGEQGSFTVLGTGGTAATPVNSGLIALLIMGVLVLATVLVLILSRKPA